MTNLLALTLIFINRFRGGGFGGQYVPGHPRWIASVLVFVVASLMAHGDMVFGVRAAVSFLLWCLPPWGRWYTLGYAPMQDGPAGRKPSWFERTIESYTANMSEAFAYRQTLGYIPAAILLTPWALASGAATWAIYEISWMVSPAGREIQIAELGTGALWGLVLLWAA